MTQRRAIVVMAVMFTSIVGAALLHVSLRLGVIRLGYAITEKTSERQRLEEENRKLRLEHSLLRNPERIERIAHEKLAMRRPDPTEIRVLNP